MGTSIQAIEFHRHRGTRGHWRSECQQQAAGSVRVAPRVPAVVWRIGKAIDRLRNVQRRHRLQDDVEKEALIDDQFDGRNSLDAVEGMEKAQLIRDAIIKLNKEQRTAIELAFFGGFTQTEIAEKLNEPLGTIKARIRRGMMKLRDLIEPWL